MATGNTRVKVSKDKLVQKIKDTRIKLETQYETDLLAYEDNLAPFKKVVIKAVDDYRNKLEKDFSGNLEDFGLWRGAGTVHIPFTADVVPKPSKPDFYNLDKMISALELSDELTITIGVNDQYYKYI